ncbi:peroxiredoxin [Nocardioides zeae]|uniref:Peroxiredoxin n=2 Tax=Nocardioides zeae TaxID=1457234 RepID=A0ACC6IGH5_9ACTN|nr:peroxiredoxin [Nocardioides zeae]MDQ1103502.1 peroxiredoxin [Nocardioides zeae]MDR6172779.1 peroxiredoxin [Nocardioides zeae]MDR6209789.1 peroxiredoxin [Nocardioides zeae]
MFPMSDDARATTPCGGAGGACDDVSALPVGAPAPDFALRDQFGQTVRLSDFRDRKAVAVLFIPFAFSGVCTGELGAVQARLASFLTFDTEVVVVSCDPVYSLRAFAERDGLDMTLLSDFWPHGAVSAAYGVFDASRGAPRRSSFVVDPRGTISWAVHNDLRQGRDLDAHLAALQQAVGEPV